MPEGSAALQNSTPTTQNKMGDLLAAEKAKKSGGLRTAPVNNNTDIAPADDNYKPYTEQGPENENAPIISSLDYPEEGNEEIENTTSQPQEQLTPEDQEDLAVSFAANKQRALQQIQAEILRLQNQMGELEKNLTDFKNSRLGGFLSIFRPNINSLIDRLLLELKKGANGLADEAKVNYYTGLITTANILIGTLTSFKFIAAVLDAAFIDSWSCLRLVITTSASIVIPIILILISPLYIPFLAVIFMIGKIPLLKGKLTKNIADLIENLKGQKDAWQKQLDKLKNKVTLQRQIKSLKKAKKQIEQKS